MEDVVGVRRGSGLGEAGTQPGHEPAQVERVDPAAAGDVAAEEIEPHAEVTAGRAIAAGVGALPGDPVAVEELWLGAGRAPDAGGRVAIQVEQQLVGGGGAVELPRGGAGGRV